MKRIVFVWDEDYLGLQSQLSLAVVVVHYRRLLCTVQYDLFCKLWLECISLKIICKVYYKYVHFVIYPPYSKNIAYIKMFSFNFKIKYFFWNLKNQWKKICLKIISQKKSLTEKSLIEKSSYLHTPLRK